ERGGGGARAGALGDRALDVVLRHRVRLGLLDRVREGEVVGRVPPAFLGGDDDRPRELREELPALRVGGALLVLYGRPLAMPGQLHPPVPIRGTAGGAACRRSVPDGTRRRGSAPRARAPDDRRPRPAPRPPVRRLRSTGPG